VILTSNFVCRFSAVAVFTVLFAATSAAAQSFQTSRISVCSNIIRGNSDRCNEVSAPLVELKRTAFPNKRIDFKLIVIGQEQALTYLQQNGFLPIKVAVWRDGFRRGADTPIDIEQEDWDSERDRWATDVNENGQFTWRTFFYVNINDARSISIEINDGSGTVVQAAGNPARIAISFSN
jgi:hypothetical protein